jgi:hypothetical protein
MEPMTWAEATAAVGEGTLVSLATLGRLPLEIKRYRLFQKTDILGKYASVQDYLNATVFGASCETNKGRKLSAGR